MRPSFASPSLCREGIGVGLTDEGIQEHLEQASELLKHDMALRPDDADDETGNP